MTMPAWTRRLQLAGRQTWGWLGGRLSPAGRRWVWRLATLASLGLVVLILLAAWRELPQTLLRFDARFLLAAAGVYMITYSMHLLGWHTLARHSFGERSLKANMAAVAGSDLVKYLPTVAWYIANRVHFYEQRGARRAVVVAASLLELVIMIGGGTLLYAAWLLVRGGGWPVLGLGLGVIGLAGLAWYGGRGWWRRRIAGPMAGRGRPAGYLLAAGWYLGSWLVGVLFLQAVLRVFAPVSWADWPLLFSIWLLAGVTGYVVSVSLGAVGVARELTLTALLAPRWSWPVAVGVAVTVKILLTLGPVLCGLAILGLVRATGGLDRQRNRFTTGV